MKLNTISRLPLLVGKRILLRCDLNIKMASGRLESTDAWKLKTVVPTIKHCLRTRARIILVSHRGRPKGVDHSETLQPILRKLEQMLGKKIFLWRGDLADLARRSKTMKSGQIVSLENIRFFNEEEKNDARFGRALANFGDIYVNDAFASVHRSHASIVAVTRYLPAYAGLLMQYEVEHLYNLLDRAPKPIAAVVGGNKISTKIRLIKRLLRRVDFVLLGGALANNVLAAMSHVVGKSLVEEDMIEWSKSLLSNKLHVPVDAQVASSLTGRARIAAIGKLKRNDMILDLGPDTVSLYENVIRASRTVIWNGPVGYFEDPRYAVATRELVKILTRVRARSYVGGGETVKAVLSERAEHRLHFISTGGGAMLAMLDGRPLPALRPLMRSRT